MSAHFVDIVNNILAERNLSSSQLSEMSNTRKGQISDALNNNRIPFNVFYKITKALDLPIEELLQSYLPSRINYKRTAWRFAKTAFEDCLTLHEYKLALVTMSMYLDTEDAYQHPAEAFILIDTFYKTDPATDYKNEMLSLYNQLSELYGRTKDDIVTIAAITEYRKIMIRISNGDVFNGEINYWLNYTLSSNIPPKMRLNALFELCRLVQFHHKDWATLEMASQRLIALVDYIKDSQKSTYRVDEMDEDLPDHLVRYYGQGFIMQTSAHTYRNNFQQAENLIKEYEDLSDFPNLDENGLVQVERFKMFAKANRYFFELEKGNLSIVSEYLNYLKNFSDDEMLPAVRKIVETANVCREKLPNEIVQKATELIILRRDLTNHQSYYVKEKLLDEYIKLIHAYAKYSFRTKNYHESMDMALKCFEVAINLKNPVMIARSLSIIENYKFHATPHQLEDYAKIRERMIDYEEVC